MSRVIKLMHSNFKRPVYCQSHLVDAWHYNEGTKSTLIYLSKGNMLPVEESCEEIERLVTEAASPQGVRPDGK